MGQVTLGDWTFDADPTSVRWDFSIKMNDTATTGGKVVQVYGTELSNMTVNGSFRTWQEQLRFVEWAKATTRRVGALSTAAPLKDDPSRTSGAEQGREIETLRFRVPQRNWDFDVMLNGVSDPKGGRSINWDVGTVVPQFRLDLIVVEDHASLTTVFENVFITRVAESFGWSGLSPFNGGLSMSDVEGFLAERGVSSVEELLSIPINSDIAALRDVPSIQGSGLTEGSGRIQ